MPLAEKADSTPAECVQVLTSEQKAIGITWVKPVKSMAKENEHGSMRRQETCFARENCFARLSFVGNAPGSKEGLLGKFPERTQTIMFCTYLS